MHSQGVILQQYTFLLCSYYTFNCKDRNKKNTVHWALTLPAPILEEEKKITEIFTFSLLRGFKGLMKDLKSYKRFKGLTKSFLKAL